MYIISMHVTGCGVIVYSFGADCLRRKHSAAWHIVFVGWFLAWLAPCLGLAGVCHFSGGCMSSHMF